jgi:NADPH-dependent 2,4-dienoyl-CoA reductase/sulfur reductase-like enzyme
MTLTYTWQRLALPERSGARPLSAYPSLPMKARHVGLLYPGPKLDRLLPMKPKLSAVVPKGKVLISDIAPLRVLISGAGIAGSTLAWFLARAGARVTVLEKSPALLPHGQNVDIQGSARTVIEKMGLTDEIRRFHTTEKGSQFVDTTGRPFAAFPVNEGSSASLTSEFEILRADLAAVLYGATKDHPNIRYVFGTTIKQVVSNSDDGVKVELIDGEVQEFIQTSLRRV